MLFEPIIWCDDDDDEYSDLLHDVIWHEMWYDDDDDDIDEYSLCSRHQRPPAVCGRIINQLIDKFIHKLIDWLIDQLIDWLINWLID